jgi:hypothetical protein
MRTLRAYSGRKNQLESNSPADETSALLAAMKSPGQKGPDRGSLRASSWSDPCNRNCIVNAHESDQAVNPKGRRENNQSPWRNRYTTGSN